MCWAVLNMYTIAYMKPRHLREPSLILEYFLHLLLPHTLSDPSQAMTMPDVSVEAASGCSTGATSSTENGRVQSRLIGIGLLGGIVLQVGNPKGPCKHSCHHPLTRNCGSSSFKFGGFRDVSSFPAVTTNTLRPLGPLQYQSTRLQ